MCHKYITNWIVSTGAVSCHPAPMVKIWFIHDKLLKFYSYSYKNMQSDGINVSVGIVGLLRVQARQCTSTPSLHLVAFLDRNTPDFMSTYCLVLTQ